MLRVRYLSSVLAWMTVLHKPSKKSRSIESAWAETRHIHERNTLSDSLSVEQQELIPLMEDILFHPRLGTEDIEAITKIIILAHKIGQDSK